ncbi:MAG TPA: prepilin-type N-terminal cleavage/methylation domain-containing protein, partial [Candidatus Methylomirabilis sp.]|nr:prepilin-type N-terminal cleavage/methylation domain-containing protein [Candidatus Methylomirabilis sp.]
MKRKSAARGFTLIEVMIAVLIVGILSAIAIPNYQSYLTRNKETTAISDIKVIEVKLKVFTAENGDVPPPDLASLNLGNLLPLIDPWGNPYQYLKISGAPGNLPHARRDHNLVPINSDFDLYSMGPDGQSAKPLTAVKSRDDIIRANDGAFIGKASTF